MTKRLGSHPTVERRALVLLLLLCYAQGTPLDLENMLKGNQALSEVGRVEEDTISAYIFAAKESKFVICTPSPPEVL